MSPSTVRRYRAERLLRDEFERLRDSVIGSVCGRLRAAGVRLDASDVDAAYAQAWQGLYAAMLEGQQILNPAGWLALVTYRRAIDEHRASRRVQCAAIRAELQEPDLASELDDRTRLRQLFEALRGRLSAREQQAATLCYLQGLSRAEAAARMGVSESRMRKLMEGRDAGSPGVAGKVGMLVETIRAGAWCEEQGSLMRGYAYGILDPGGERYTLALIHRDECPACRAYVLSLRGLAAVLPPVPLLLQLTLGASAATGVAGSGAVAASGAGAGVAGAGVAGVAGGGWWLVGGPLGAKLAVGCLLALGVGAGCVALGGGAAHVRTPGRHVAPGAHASRSTSAHEASGAALAGGRVGLGEPSNGRATGAAPAARSTIGGMAQASREFRLEQAIGAGRTRTSASTASSTPTAKAASTGRAPTAAAEPTMGKSVSGASSGARGTPSAAVSSAEREFAPG